MSPMAVDLPALVQRMADRRPGRTEANVQSDLHMLLTAAPPQLEDGDLQEIVLESLQVSVVGSMSRPGSPCSR